MFDLSLKMGVSIILFSEIFLAPYLISQAQHICSPKAWAVPQSPTGKPTEGLDQARDRLTRKGH